jgi:predicted nucleotidyltransferase component of viral defense system
MAKTILNSFQQKTLEIFKNSVLVKQFYLSGGTALAEFYLQHRLSEDLDFFTKEELNLEELKKFINLVAKKTGIIEIKFQHGFGLYSFFLKDKKQLNKIDFGQYPFGPIEKLNNFNGIYVESLYDIAVNKAQTIAFRPRLRDFIDLYFILQQKKDWTFQELLKKSFEKFEMKADDLQIGENLLEVKNLADMPKMIKKVELSKVQYFFLGELNKLKKEIWKK